MVKNILGLCKMKESSSINETFNLAYKNHEKNFSKKAEDLYKKVLNIDPNHFESIFLLGTLKTVSCPLVFIISPFLF